MQHFTSHPHSRLTTHSFPLISHSVTHPSALLSQLWASSVADKEQWEFSLANKGSCLIFRQWRSLPSLTWPKQKMQPSAPFTTDWMTSATVPEHTSACEKHTQRQHAHSQFAIQPQPRNTVTQAHGEHCIQKDIIYTVLNGYLALLAPNHINAFTILHHSGVCVVMCDGVRCNVRLIFTICSTMGPLGQGFCSRGPFPYITQQTRPLTAEQLAVAVSHQQCCPSGTI